MNAAPTNWHQKIATNISAELNSIARARNAAWTLILGIRTRVPLSQNGLPQPDVQVLEHPLGREPSSITDDSIVLVEVLSRSNAKADQAWRRRVYTRIANCQHYVTVAQNGARVIRYDLTDGWREHEITGLAAALALPALGAAVRLALADIYRGTPIH